jgi:hypothetical protein
MKGASMTKNELIGQIILAANTDIKNQNNPDMHYSMDFFPRLNEVIGFAMSRNKAGKRNLNNEKSFVKTMEEIITYLKQTKEIDVRAIMYLEDVVKERKAIQLNAARENLEAKNVIPNQGRVIYKDMMVKESR